MEDITRLSLVLRLRDPQDQRAWEEFVQHYHPSLLKWALRCGVQHADAEDVASQVLMRLHRYLPRFEYDRSKGRFRSYLQRVTRTVVSDLFREWKKTARTIGAENGSFLFAILSDPHADSDLLTTLENEHRMELVRLAESAAQNRCHEDHVWSCYDLVDRQGRKPADVAGELGVPISRVYTYRARVRKMIQEEFERLNQ